MNIALLVQNQEFLLLYDFERRKNLKKRARKTIEDSLQLTRTIVESGYNPNMARDRTRDKKRKTEKMEKIAKAEDELSKLSDIDFRKKYRVTKQIFENILNSITPLITTQYRFGGRYQVPARLKLASTLRYLAGGSYLDISSIYSTSQRTFYNHRDLVMDAIIQCFPIVPPTRLEARDIAENFKQKSDLSCCVGAIDGLLIRVNQKRKDDYTRKGFPAVNLQGIAGPNGEFLYVNTQCYGSVPDGQAIRVSCLWEAGYMQFYFYFTFM